MDSDSVHARVHTDVGGEGEKEGSSSNVVDENECAPPLRRFDEFYAKSAFERSY